MTAATAPENATGASSTNGETPSNVKSKSLKKGDMASSVQVSLTTARRVLWKGQPLKPLAWALNPCRVFVFDPMLAIQVALLPLMVPTSIDPYLAACVDVLGISLLSCLYLQKKEENAAADGSNCDVVRNAAKTAIIQPSVVAVRPPTDFQAAFQGAVSFVTSAIGDVAGLISNPKKFQGWVAALGQFNTFLQQSGVGGEMEEAIQKPLLGGRLLDNFKILNDIQEIHHSDRIEAAQMDGEEARTKRFQEDILRGHRLMRFATAAYGTEMIRSAVDVEVDASEFLYDDNHFHAIALHTRLPKENVIFVNAGNDHDYEKHVLHHFCAVDHDAKAVVLAIRGTLSLSGAIVDIQGMSAPFCAESGLKAHGHKGIAEMAQNLWNHSGKEVEAVLAKHPDYKLVITGHSLGAGTSCLLTLYLCVNDIFPEDRVVECFAFAPPPTFFQMTSDDNTGCNQPSGPCSAKVARAIQNTVAYIHDNDVVPFLSVAAVRRMVNLLDAVDNETEHIWFWKRWRIFYEYDPIPEKITKSVLAMEKEMSEGKSTVCLAVDGECNMTIPARRVVWCKHSCAGRFEAYSCDPKKVAQGNIFLTPDMISDHLPEMYEDALDDILAQYQAKDEL